MIFDSTISLGNILTMLSMLIGILLAFWQLRVSNKQNRAQFILALMDKHFNNDNTLQMLYLLEYNKFKFNEQKFPLSSEEKMLDKLLYTFDQIATLYDFGIIKRKDLCLIEYDFLRVFENVEVQKYFHFLDISPHGLSTNKADFQAYRRTAKKMIDNYNSKKNST
jgi:hypothetical protein